MNPSATVTPLQRISTATWPRHWWLNAACAIATLLTTTVFGSALVSSFRNNRAFDPEFIWLSYARLLHGDSSIWLGLTFSLPLLLILTAHELGHYLQCRRWKLTATLPFFIPSPTLFGTFGAFIRIQTPIVSRCSLFDVGIAGPLAGFAALVPFLIMGVALSHRGPADMAAGTFVFGSPLAIRLLEAIFFPRTPPAQILLHPFAVAAWVGILATAINLLPVGQLDGGHIIYATLGPRLHRVISTVFIAVLVILGFWYWSWWAWAIVLFFFGRRHPLVHDSRPLPPNRWLLVAAVCAIFLLSFNVIPVRVGP